jgi:hypothetical protein
VINSMKMTASVAGTTTLSLAATRSEVIEMFEGAAHPCADEKTDY